MTTHSPPIWQVTGLNLKPDLTWESSCFLMPNGFVYTGFSTKLVRPEISSHPSIIRGYMTYTVCGLNI